MRTFSESEIQKIQGTQVRNQAHRRMPGQSTTTKWQRTIWSKRILSDHLIKPWLYGWGSGALEMTFWTEATRWKDGWAETRTLSRLESMAFSATHVASHGLFIPGERLRKRISAPLSGSTWHSHLEETHWSRRKWPVTYNWQARVRNNQASAWFISS